MTAVCRTACCIALPEVDMDMDPVATDIETDMDRQLWIHVSIDMAMIMPRYGY